MSTTFRIRSPRLNYDVALLKAMADGTRQEILNFLCAPANQGMKQFSVTDITNNFELTASTVSHHLQLLRRAELVTVERRGKERLYALNWELLRTSVAQFNDLLSMIDRSAPAAAAA